MNPGRYRLRKLVALFVAAVIDAAFVTWALGRTVMRRTVPRGILRRSGTGRARGRRTS